MSIQYIHEFYHKKLFEEVEPRDVINEYLGQVGFVAQPHIYTTGIASAIQIRPVDSDNAALLSEFPGNCSSAVISNITITSSTIVGGSYVSVKTPFKEAILAAEHLCRKLRYAALFVSVADVDMKNAIMDMGFTIVLGDLPNPHSGYINYYLVKVLDYGS